MRSIDGYVKWELSCPQSSRIVPSADLEPWTLDELFSKSCFLELELEQHSDWSPKQAKRPLSFERNEMDGTVNKPFVMHVSDDDEWEVSTNDDEESHGQNLMTGTRFSVTDLDFSCSDSEGSDDELHQQMTPYLMKKISIEESVLFEYEHEYELKLKEEVRNELSALEAGQREELERTTAAFLRLGKSIELKREMDRRLDKQYQRKSAEALDSHLSAVQRDHEQRSQIEERRIKDDAALEEARRKEKALLEEEERLEKAKAEAEARAKAAKVSEELQKAALEAARRAYEETALKEAAKAREAKAAEFAEDKANEQKTAASVENLHKAEAEGRIPKKTAFTKPKGIEVHAADTALKAESIRLKIYDEVDKGIGLSSNKEFTKCERQISRCLRQIVGTQQKVRESASQLINIIRDPLRPPTISMFLIAKMGYAYDTMEALLFFIAPKLYNTNTRHESECISMLMRLCATGMGSALSIFGTYCVAKDLHGIVILDVVSQCENKNTGEILDGTAFAYGHVILLVMSQVPLLRDFILAAFHKGCIYTVPKHFQASASISKSMEFLNLIGYREEDGQVETTDSYMDRVERHMKLYAALIQTEMQGITSPGGLREGWAWLARFLNKIPVTRASAVALKAFLEMAGFQLHRRYGRHFLKILKNISSYFLPALKKRRNESANDVIRQIENYLHARKYLEEPEGWRLKSAALMSNEIV